MESQLLTIKHLWPLDTYYSITEFLLPTEWVNARSVSLKMIATDKSFFLQMAERLLFISSYSLLFV